MGGNHGYVHHHFAHRHADGAPHRLRATRRGVLAALGLVPAAMVLGPNAPAWALTNAVEVTEADGYRLIRANGIPAHGTGTFPNRHNPNSIAAQRYEFRVPLAPRRLPESRPYAMQLFGVAVNGVPFDPFTAEFWQRDRHSGWRYEAMTGKLDLGLDDSNAHVQPNGAYHYHGVPNGLVARWSPDRHSAVVGWAADGFPIYLAYGFSFAGDPASPVRALKSSWRLRQGQRPGGPGGPFDGTFVEDFEYVAGLGDLDEANGRDGVTPEYPQGTYAYFLTGTYPFVPRFFRGEPDPSFRHGPPGGGPGGPGGPGGFGPPPGRFGPPPRERR
ncbi:MAG: YHYH protein [Alphaproteobacteria bacterium]